MCKDEVNKKFGQRLIYLRSCKGWTQSDFARACNKDRQAIEKLENGKVNPSLFTLWELSQTLEIELSELVKFDSEDTNRV